MKLKFTYLFFSVFALFGCQSIGSHAAIMTDTACVISAQFVSVTSSYETKTCARLYGNVMLEAEPKYHSIFIDTANISSTVYVHETLLEIPNDLASKHHFESAFRSANATFSEKLKDIWPDSPRLCWILYLVPEYTRLDEEYAEKATDCVPVKLSVRFKSNGNPHYGIADRVAIATSIQLHETCHILSRLKINRQRTFFSQSGSEELACSILSAWAEPLILSTLFEPNVKTSYPDVEPSWQNALIQFESAETRYTAIRDLAQLLAFNRTCESSMNSTSPNNGKILELFHQVYTVERPVREIVEREFSNSCKAVSLE